MAQPPAYERQFDFTNFSTTNPSTPQPGVQIDLELNEIKQTLDALLTNIELIQRDDGKLANESVHKDSLSEATVKLIAGGWTPQGEWATATSYVFKDVVSHEGSAYVALEGHTSNSFDTDLANDRWMRIDIGALDRVGDVNAQTDDYELVLTDAGKVIEVAKATAVNVTVPPESSVDFPVDTVVHLTQTDAGQVTVVAGSGVTVRTPTTLKLRTRWSTATLRKRGADDWILSGDLASS